MYKFTNKLPARVCRICGKIFEKEWGAGGVGAVCQTCAPIRDKIDLVKEGIVRNIKIKKSPKRSFEFESYIDGNWYKCGLPCGDWSFVYGYPEKHNIFSVPVGWCELAELYERHNK